jgi:hypothetical protein
MRLPEEIPSVHLATLAPPSPILMLLGFPPRLTLAGMNCHSSNATEPEASTGAGCAAANRGPGARAGRREGTRHQ